MGKQTPNPGVLSGLAGELCDGFADAPSQPPFQRQRNQQPPVDRRALPASHLAARVRHKNRSGGVNDPRCLDDASSLLGALSPAEEQEFQRHLRHCLRCRESLQDLPPVLSLLALALPDDVGK